MSVRTYDTVVVGGGPAGATAAHTLALAGRSVLLIDRAGRIKPCGGAIPPALIREFEIPDRLLAARAFGARIFAPSAKRVDMPIEDGFVGMVEREIFDEWLRERAAEAGAERLDATFERLTRDDDGTSVVHYRERRNGHAEIRGCVRARTIVGADGALSNVARQAIPGVRRVPFVFAYHEIVRAPKHHAVSGYDTTRCDIYYQRDFSPDFYAWIFPHGETASVGTGSANKGFSLRGATAALRHATGLDGCETLRREGAPIPLRPLKRWDNGRDVILAGDAAGVVAPASGEGIYYAMTGGRLAAEAVDSLLTTGDTRSLAVARKRFMQAHGRVFWILGLMQYFWYSSEWRRERFVTICKDRDVQRLTWEAYMNKRLVRSRPMAHVRIFFKDLAHLLRLVSP